MPSSDAGLSAFVMLMVAPRGPRYSISLSRGLAILRCFSSELPVRGVAEIADELDLSRSTTHRYMSTLAALGYLDQDPGSGRKYRLAGGVNDLGMAVLGTTGLREPARPILLELRGKTGLSVSMGIFDGSDVLCCERVPSLTHGQAEIESTVRVGSRRPARSTAIGRVLLAYLPEAEREQRLRTLTLRQRASKDASESALNAELQQIHDTGIALDGQQNTAGLVSIAAPVCGASGSFSPLSI